MKRAERFTLTKAAVMPLFPDDREHLASDETKMLFREELPAIDSAQPPPPSSRRSLPPPPPSRSVPPPPRNAASSVRVPPPPPPRSVPASTQAPPASTAANFPRLSATTSPALTSELLEGKVLVNQYVVERVVGKMGSCIVVKVRHSRNGGRLLLKYLAPRACSAPRAIEQFLAEARAAMRLRSPFTARTVDAGRLEGGLPYLVTESFQGTELREVLRIRGSLGRTEAVDVALQAAHAIAEARAHGIAHGSLSPSALFLTPGAEGPPMVKVLDFGSAGTLRRDPFSVRLRHWSQGTALFSESIRLWDTVACTAPERLRGSLAATPAGDIWALGAILYELLLGAPPFTAPTTPALLAAIVADQPRSARKLGQRLPQELERVLLRCLSKSPDARFRSVYEFAAALRRFASPDAQSLVDLIASIDDHDNEQASFFAAEGARAEPEPERAAETAPTLERVLLRSQQIRWAASLVLISVGALAGIVAGTFVTRALTSHGAVRTPSVSLPTSQRR
jgi:serine/threonine-protein kinase